MEFEKLIYPGFNKTFGELECFTLNKSNQYEALLEVYEDKDYNLIVDYKNYTSTFVLKEEPKNDRN